MIWRAVPSSIAWGLIVVLLAAGAPAQTPSGDDLEAQTQQAREALLPLKKALMKALKAALQDSARAAVDVCQVSAPAITDSAGSAKVRVGRTSHRLRNPQNAPEPWMEPLLAAYLEAPRAPGSSRTVRLDRGRVGYVEPIYMKPLCTTCHGSAVDPALLSHIRARYPDDRAIGFEEGELRGLFWVVIAE